MLMYLVSSGLEWKLIVGARLLWPLLNTNDWGIAAKMYGTKAKTNGELTISDITLYEDKTMHSQK